MDFANTFRRLWQRWQTILEREEAEWQERGGHGRDETAPSADPEQCGSAPKAPSLADLVNERQSELKHDR